MNYIIWKNINSKTLKGLIISELPPISKPAMRVQETIVDGVDGSIIEELGYEAYDKEIFIGLSKDFDINEIIKYFSGEGEVVFSNEPDKYYKAKIINQIDYERLLRFRTATVTFRVQPFKYKYQEEEESLKADEIQGTNILLDNKVISKISVEGFSIQDGTPTPDAPIEIKNLNNDITIKITSKNKLNIQEIVKGRLDSGVLGYASNVTELIKNNDSFSFTTNARYRGVSSEFIQVQEGQKLYYSQKEAITNDLGINASFFDKEYKFLSIVNLWNGIATVPANAKYIRLCWMKTEVGAVTITNPQLEINEVATVFEEYKEQLAILPLNEGQKLYEGSYLTDAGIYNMKKQVVLDGTEGWVQVADQTGNNTAYFYFTKLDMKTGSSIICDKFLNRSTWGTDTEAIQSINDKYIRLRINKSRASTTEELKSWLSTNKPVVEYELENEEIVPYTEEQKEAYKKFKNPNLLNETSNITNNLDANMIIYYVGNKLIATNTGNYFSKPIITIVGAGTIELIVNNEKLFRYTFPATEDTVIIDSQKQDAYWDNVLKNRNMSGEFPVLNIGENDITWDGIISNMKISLQSRWL